MVEGFISLERSNVGGLGNTMMVSSLESMFE